MLKLREEGCFNILSKIRLVFTFFSLSLAIFLFIACAPPKKVDMNFYQIYVHNNSSSNTIDIITNVEVINYNPNTMNITVSNMKSSSLLEKNKGLEEFITKTNIFPWKRKNPIKIKLKQSYSIFKRDCEKSVIVRIENSYTNITITEYYKKYFFALFDPPICGLNYYIDITNKNDP